ncbi:hypothetical protein BXZ70DRAFT_48655 [Cristinia sonorae]|uniref:Uncharacterized protein n=1 Tax=Cristinia sonorae TaxID=1940300 RepID=A0A8K0URV8_9AGAR|nr:hypothetical protein BXZ70DRAFT_48655 [Cristinia sonorae]
MVRVASAVFIGLLSTVSSLVAAAPLQPRYPPQFDYETPALEFVAKKWPTEKNLFFDFSILLSTGAAAVVRQTVNDHQPLWNSYAKVDFNKDNAITGLESQHFNINFVEPNVPSISPENIIASLSQSLNAEFDTSLEQNPDVGYVGVGSAAKFAYILRFRSKADNTPVTAYVSAKDGSVLLTADKDSDPWVAI